MGKGGYCAQGEEESLKVHVDISLVLMIDICVGLMKKDSGGLKRLERLERLEDDGLLYSMPRAGSMYHVNGSVSVTHAAVPLL